jgi:hypothetical protein
MRIILGNTTHFNNTFFQHVVQFVTKKERDSINENGTSVTLDTVKIIR